MQVMGSQKRRRRRKQDRLVLNLLIIVTLVLVVFEGKLVYTMFSHHSSMSEAHATSTAGTAVTSNGSVSESEAKQKPTTALLSESYDTVFGETTLAGLPDKFTTASAPAEKNDTLPTVSDPDSPAIVPKSETSVDDSYFSDAVFIGDSRMEGFRNASGITQGQFFTSVGMSLSSMRSDPIISTSEGNITVAAALSGGLYNKIYIMLGTNDLGEYDWNSFRDGFISTMERFQEIQPTAIIYVCSVIYVDESKASSTQYVNNANVDKVNSILLDICAEKGYYYLDLNEFLSNGYGALIDGASSDGVHLYAKYCQQMLDYLKSHYIEVEASDGEGESEHITGAETEAAADDENSDTENSGEEEV